MPSKKQPITRDKTKSIAEKGQWVTFDPKGQNSAEYVSTTQAKRQKVIKSGTTEIDFVERPDVQLVSVLFQMLAEQHSLSVRTVRALQKKLSEAVHKGAVIFDHPIHRTAETKEPTLAFLSYTKFNQWLASIGTLERITAPKPLARQAHGDNRAAQKKAILNLIRQLGQDPERLPPFVPPKPTIKKTVRETLMRHPNHLFGSAGVVNEVWQICRDEGLIKDAEQANRKPKKKPLTKT